MPYLVHVGPFESREDAVAFIDLAGGLVKGKCQLSEQRGAGGRGGEKPVRETRTGKCILNFMSYGRSYHYQDIAGHLQENGFSENTASSRLSDLAKEGDVKSYGDGIYQKVPRG